jgi:uncharacterized protein YgbK (DUF1537 family)
MAVDYAFIGDDLTGASDTLATLGEAGQACCLFLGAPDATVIAREGLTAVGIATQLRTLPPAAIAAHIAALAESVSALSPRFVHYKVCSTFDSSPAIGSIGAAAQALERHVSPAVTLILGGQPTLGRFCLFGTLFARGPDGFVHRIDRHPVMSRHPVTPMGEADLRLHLAAQGLGEIALESWLDVRRGPDVLARRLSTSPQRRILLDAATPEDVAAIGAALHHVAAPNHRLLVIGPSSVAEAYAAGRRTPAVPVPIPSGAGPCLALAGSRSAVTAAQVAAATLYERMPVRRADLCERGAARVAACAAAGLRQGKNVLVHLLPDENYDLAPTALSDGLARLAADIAAQAPVHALAIAGGDTSGAIVDRLSIRRLVYLRRVDAGVPMVLAFSHLEQEQPRLLVLKGGQVGAPDLFDRVARTVRQ